VPRGRGIGRGLPLRRRAREAQNPDQARPSKYEIRSCYLRKGGIQAGPSPIQPSGPGSACGEEEWQVLAVGSTWSEEYVSSFS
jgi:hypothetical protein